MNRLPDKEQIAETIRSEMARKNIPAKDLAEKLGYSRTTMTAIRYGNSSYEKMVATMDFIDNWEEK